MVRVPWLPTAKGVVLTVRLTPKGGRDSIDGIGELPDGRAILKAHVRAVPAEGQANAALVRLIAKAIGVPLRDVALTAGDTVRLKRLVISGDCPTLIAALEKIAFPR